MNCDLNCFKELEAYVKARWEMEEDFYYDDAARASVYVFGVYTAQERAAIHESYKRFSYHYHHHNQRAA